LLHKVNTMNSNQSSKPDHVIQEEKILDFWRDADIFRYVQEKESPKGIFHFFEGPPTANGRPGIHHVLARSFKDIMLRYKTMQGFHVRRKAGWDTHGLPVELQVEKQLGLQSKKEIEQFGITEFNQKCRESVWEYKDEWEKLTRRMGYWLDMEYPYITYETSYIEALWGIVKKISERKTKDDTPFLYRDFKVLPWCARCGTALSSHELNQPGAYKDVKDLSVYAKFKLLPGQKIGDFEVDDNTYFVAWTTTPWTLPGNVALAVGAEIKYQIFSIKNEKGIRENYLVMSDFNHHLSDIQLWQPSEKEAQEWGTVWTGSQLVGLKYEPLYPFMRDLVKDQDEAMQKAYQVYPADFVTTTDGTGIVHTAVMYGQDDFELGTNLGLPKFHLVNEDGKFIEGTDFLSGRFVKEKNEKGEESLAIDIIKDLAHRGLLFKKEKYEHSYPHCWRCDTPLIYYARTSWYFRMSALREQMLEANKEIHWEPEHVRDGRFGEWLDGIKDWAISRDRYWGTPLPIWTTKSGKQLVIGSCEELRTYASEAITKIIFVRHGEAEHNVLKMSSSARDKHPLTEKGQEQARRAAEALLNHDIDVVYASPILRARQTAEAYAGRARKDIIFDNRLGEITSGEWEETTQLDPQVKEARDHYKNLSTNERYTFKRGKTGESWEDLDRRTWNFLKEVIQKHAGKTIALFSHQGTGSAMIKQLKGMSNEEAVEKIFHNMQVSGNAAPSVMYVDTKRMRELDLHKPFIDDLSLEYQGEVLTRTPEVIDVWFDSGAMPIAQDHVIGQSMHHDPQPADYIAEGVDQTRGWFYTMHAIANLLHTIPKQAYKNVICLGLVLDANGQKMSKSRGNVVSPWDMFETYGADVVRMWFYSVNQPGEFKNFDEKALDEVNKKTFNILRNIVSFYEMYATTHYDLDPWTSPHVLDQWILALWNKTLLTVTAGLEKYQPLDPARALRDFITEFSQWYIRRSRDRFKSDDAHDKDYAIATTQYILQELAKALAPFTPFIAEEIWQKVGKSESVHLENYPIPKSVPAKILDDMDAVRTLVTLGFDARQKAGIKVRQPLAQLSIPQHELGNEYLEILKDELNIKNILIDENVKEGTVLLDIEVTPELKDEGEMRELVRRLQDMRKAKGFVPTDLIAIMLQDSEPKWFAMYQNHVLATVGSVSITWNHSEDEIKKIS
jgi:isoleucyl-tRNA synthetase